MGSSLLHDRINIDINNTVKHFSIVEFILVRF